MSSKFMNIGAAVVLASGMIVAAVIPSAATQSDNPWDTIKIEVKDSPPITTQERCEKADGLWISVDGRTSCDYYVYGTYAWDDVGGWTADPPGATSHIYYRVGVRVTASYAWRRMDTVESGVVTRNWGGFYGGRQFDKTNIQSCLKAEVSTDVSDWSQFDFLLVPKPECEHIPLWSSDGEIVGYWDVSGDYYSVEPRGTGGDGSCLFFDTTFDADGNQPYCGGTLSQFVPGLTPSFK